MNYKELSKLSDALSSKETRRLAELVRSAGADWQAFRRLMYNAVYVEYEDGTDSKQESRKSFRKSASQYFSNNGVYVQSVGVDSFIQVLNNPEIERLFVDYMDCNDVEYKPHWRPDGKPFRRRLASFSEILSWVEDLISRYQG